MYPVLLNFGPISITSFGVFLALAVLLALFLVWRLIRVYDIDAQKTFDLYLLSFLGGLLGARLLFVVLNWNLFGSLGTIALINRYPGLSFWGGLFGGIMTLWLFTKRTKLNFWQIADFGAVGLAAGLILGDTGCFLGGCSYGVMSQSPIAMSVVGIIGKRIPITLFEAMLMFGVYFYLWKQVIRFHFFGKIAALFLVFLGGIKFMTEYYRGDVRYIPGLELISLSQIFSLTLILWGILIFYVQSKRKVQVDLVKLVSIFYSSKRRQILLSSLKRSWYNRLISWKVQFRKKF